MLQHKHSIIVSQISFCTTLLQKQRPVNELPYQLQIYHYLTPILGRLEEFTFNRCVFCVLASLKVLWCGFKNIWRSIASYPQIERNIPLLMTFDASYLGRL
ncbi:Hypothetical_protein [Hexamita inflata]|uniref:Hypothetical_protein n=1 Tax=Hexamita inflata TaxID=28002 RepID=A0AA86QKU1_9EUKA|nr:Hypothetical protein HINF_LOCUS24668 [Hexamita inflata]CAI9961409.1 Hypothetical protein HINF_LOCUS49054 [Hexamita inflata]